MVNLKALEAAITQVERIRDHEFSFEAGGMEIALRALRPDEETEVQRYAQIALEGRPSGDDAPTDQASFTDFMDRLRHAALGYSIVQMGALDLRDVEYIETEEEGPGGLPVSLPKWEAMRDQIATEWSRTMLTEVFGKYGELIERLEIRASKSVKFDPVDLDAEIKRVEKRLEELREMRKSKAEKDEAAVARDLSASEAPQAPRQPPQEAPQPSSPPQQPVSQPPQGSPQRRQSAVPAQGPAPNERREAAAPATPPEQEPQQPEEPAPVEVDAQNIPVPHDGDSFFDPTEPDEAMEAETRRQAVLHRQHVQRQRERKLEAQRREALGLPSEAEMARQTKEASRRSEAPQGAVRIDPRTASLRDAANLSDSVFDTGAGSIQSARPAPSARGAPASQGAQLHGKPVYKMPTQTLDRSQKAAGREDAPAEAVQVNPRAGSRNEKFRGPQGR